MKMGHFQASICIQHRCSYLRCQEDHKAFLQMTFQIMWPSYSKAKNKMIKLNLKRSFFFFFSKSISHNQQKPEQHSFFISPSNLHSILPPPPVSKPKPLPKTVISNATLKMSPKWDLIAIHQRWRSDHSSRCWQNKGN